MNKTTLKYTLLLIPASLIIMALPGWCLTNYTEVNGELLTVKADNVHLGSVLEDISAKNGMKVHFWGPKNDPVSADMERVPLEEGLKRLVRNYNHVFVYESKGDRKRISELFMIQKTGDEEINAVWAPDFNQSYGDVETKRSQGAPVHPAPVSGAAPVFGMASVDPLVKFQNSFPENPVEVPDDHELNLKPPSGENNRKKER